MTWNIPAAMKWCFAFMVAQWLRIPWTFQLLGVLMFLDYTSGILVAFIRKEVSSEVGARGIAKKLLQGLLVFLCHYVDSTMTDHLGVRMNLGHVGALGFVANETISIIENCARGGVKIDARLIEALVSVQKLRSASPAAEESQSPIGERERA